jgi:Arc/MetJ-type ribon-helix-helix transcriptional regulator
MDFRKITISIPEKMYAEAVSLIKKGLFSNFSDLVRSGIREELKELRPVIHDIDEQLIYRDKELMKGVAESLREAKKGRGRKFKDKKEMNDYLNSL